MPLSKPRPLSDDFSKEWLEFSFAQMHQSSRIVLPPSIKLRKERVQRLRDAVNQSADDLTAAVQADFGMRSQQLTEVADLFVLRVMLHQLLSNIDAWSKPKAVSTPFYLKPATAYIMQQPLGVVGVMSPWNYPIQLALGPLAIALAAGNRVMLKPSEMTEQTAAVLSDMLQKHFSEDEVTVHRGGPSMAQAFSRLPFDHLFFTGSTQTGKQVALAAAQNLTPTTLELGGKTPCIIDKSATMEQVVMKIAHGKLLNAGQTCIAPDYVLLPKSHEADFVQAMRRAVSTLFPSIENNPEYASIINQNQWDRLQSLLVEAQAQGAKVIDIGPKSKGDTAHRQMRPVLVLNPPENSRLLKEEIFGPILPVVTCETPAEAIAIVNAQPRPLALYWFGNDDTARDAVLQNTVSGGVCINDALMHFAHENLPFGGVGSSGWGAYHGEAGFARMSMQKPVFVQSRFAMGDVFYPPYGPRFKSILGMLKRFL